MHTLEYPDLKPLIRCNEQILDWHEKGKRLPGYVPHNGGPFLARLLDYDGGMPVNGFKLVKWLNQHHPGICENITGPNGWAVMRALIIRKEQRDGKEKAKTNA